MMLELTRTLYTRLLNGRKGIGEKGKPDYLVPFQGCKTMQGVIDYLNTTEGLLGTITELSIID